MQFAQVLLTDEQALMAATALRLILEDDEKYVLTDEERDSFTKLAGFFGMVAEQPTAFAPKGAMAATVKKIVRRAKGAAQPVSQSKRKAKRSQGRQKRDRAARRELVAAYNTAVEAYERDRQEMVEELNREMEERFANEPRVQVVDVDGRILMSEIPASMVVPMFDASADDNVPDVHDDPSWSPESAARFGQNDIYVPGQRPDA